MKQASKQIAVISNGHGEDLMASLLADRLRDEGFAITAFPMVGEGGAYARRGIPIAGVQRTMPSGGFIWKGATNLLRDLRAGLLGLTLAQMRELKKCRGRFDAVIALGDIFCLWLAGRVLKKPAIFVPTAKSEYISGHYPFEYRMMRRHAIKIFPRDESTANAMVRRGLPAEFVGNLMMDALDMQGIDFFSDSGERSGERPVVALLPGSREEAYENAVDLAQAALALPARFRFLFSLAPGLEPGRLQQRLQGGDGGWRFAPRSESDPAGVAGVLESGEHRIVVVQGHFGDLLSAADVVIGLAGTGNEQAVGLGKPLVTFPGRGAQFTRRFAVDQRKLLGDSLSLVERDPGVIAQEVQAILGDPARYARMAEEGKRRMGPPGALDRMTAKIGQLIG